MQDQKLVLDVKEVQSLLGVSRVVAYRISREIGIRIGRRVKVSKERLIEYIQGN